jgi:hypothetical protein
VFLADKFIERARAHARGEGRRAVCALKACPEPSRRIDIFLFLEKVVHMEKIRRGANSASHFRLGTAGFSLAIAPGD